MATKIVTKNSSTASAVPTASDLVQGELAVNVADKRLFTEDNLGAIVELGTNPSGNVTFQDNGKAIFGAGSDLQIYHDGANSYVADAGTGDLILRGSTGIKLQSGSGALEYLSTNSSTGSVELKLSSSTKLATTSTGIDVTGNVTIPTGNKVAFDTDGLTYISEDIDERLRFWVANTEFMRMTNTTTDEIRLLPYGGTVYTPNLDVTGDILLDNASYLRFETSSGGAVRMLGINAGNVAYVGAIDSGATSTIFNASSTSNTASFYTAGSERMRIDSLGNVGIGTSSPSSRLDVNGQGCFTNTYSFASTNYHIKLKSAYGTGISSYISNISTDNRMDISTGGYYYGASLYQLTDGATGMGAINISEDGTLTYQSTTGATANSTVDPIERMRIDASGNVGIGTSSPDSLVDVVGADPILTIRDTETALASTNATLRLAESGAGDALGNYWDINYTANNALRVLSGTSERARIDSSGNVLVGKTSTGFGTAGIELFRDNQVYVTSTTHGLAVNRLSSDGAVAKFYKDGTTVGAVSTWGGELAVGRLNCGLLFDDDNNHITPHSVNTNLNRDAAIDLGDITSRFKDLYLSGSVQMGGNLDVVGQVSSYDNVGASYGTMNFRATDFVYKNAGGSERMRIASSGNVGIGTSSPSAKVTVSGTGVGAAIDWTNTTASTGRSYRWVSLNNGTGFAMEDLTAGSERMRIDSSGNLLVGTTDNTPYNNSGTGNSGSALHADGLFSAAREGNAVGIFNRLVSDGDIVEFRKDGLTKVGSIGSYSSSYLTVGNNTSGLAFLDAGSPHSIRPHNVSTNVSSDDLLDLGATGARFNDIYATNGTIQTSDRNEKQDIEALSEAEQRVAVAAKGLLRKFRWKDSVAEKGDDARIHFGIIAQDLQAAFEAEGLDAGDYAMFISTTWTDEETNEEKTRMGVRYSELLAFIISAI